MAAQDLHERQLHVFAKESAQNAQLDQHSHAILEFDGVSENPQVQKSDALAA